MADDRSAIREHAAIPAASTARRFKEKVDGSPAGDGVERARLGWLGIDRGFMVGLVDVEEVRGPVVSMQPHGLCRVLELFSPRACNEMILKEHRSRWEAIGLATGLAAGIAVLVLGVEGNPVPDSTEASPRRLHSR